MNASRAQLMPLAAGSRTRAARVSTWLVSTLLVVAGMGMLAPVVWVVLQSFETPADQSSPGPVWTPSQLTLGSYRTLFSASPFGVNILDFPMRFPIPAKVTIEVLPEVDLEDRFGPKPDPDRVYEELTGEMQDTLSELSEERTAPVLG